MKLDTASVSRAQKIDAYLPIDNNYAWSDGIVVVYDVGSESSFEYAKQLIECIKREHKVTSKSGSLLRFSKKKKCKPVILIGNKADVLVSFVTF